MLVAIDLMHINITLTNFTPSPAFEVHTCKFYHEQVLKALMKRITTREQYDKGQKQYDLS